jgi:single-stranded-DNA-specific exonuclease
MQSAANQILERLDSESQRLPAGLCLFDAGWHQGVIGILAARVRQRVQRPVIVFAVGNDGELKGSARSIPDLHIRDALAAIDAEHPGLIVRFGGHAMAAGLSLKEEDLPRFEQLFARQVSAILDQAHFAGIVYSDGPLSATELSLQTADLLRAAGPWGQGFPEPTFDGVFEVAESRVLHDRHLRLQLYGDDDETPLEAIAFNAPEALREFVPSRIRMVYRLEANEYRGRRRLQLLVEYLEPVADDSLR